MKRPIVAACLLALAAPAAAQSPVPSVERSVKALPNKDTQIGLYLNVREDCTSGPLAHPSGSRKGRYQNRESESDQLQGVPGTRTAGLYRDL
jgi:hypothetical protein